ncbi:hypothetical protein BGZ68_010357 [Mortierella alpina]|nr:hypothetical protein BGZ68_010357 [Mortierella alpina]
MKATFLLSIAALMALVAAQSPNTTANRTTETNVAATPSPVLEDTTIVDDLDLDGLAYSDDADDVDDVDDADDADGDDTVISAYGSSSSKFRVWSEANSHGRKQTTKGSAGCFRLDGRHAVASYEGSSDKQYGFYKGRNCDEGAALYTSKDKRIKRISPRIYPRSVRILDKGNKSSTRSLTVWSKDKYHGDRQKVYGKGCQSLNGLSIRSFKGEGSYRYKFYPDRECFGKALLETRGGNKRSTSRIRPRSVYIYRK